MMLVAAWSAIALGTAGLGYRWRHRTLRLCAMVIVAAVAGFGSVGGIIALVLAVVMAATAAVGSCPLYLPLHINTAKRASSR